MRKLCGIVVLMILTTLTYAGCKGGSTPTGPDPIPTLHTLNNISFQRVIVRSTPPAGFKPTDWIVPANDEWARECTQIETLPDGRWTCRQGFDNLPAGEYKIAFSDDAAA